MTGLVILEIVRCVDKWEVREKSFCRNSHWKFVQIVVLILRIVVYALFYLENLNWENRCFTVAKTSFRSVKEVLHNKSALRRSICTVVKWAERNLCACSWMHCVKVMDKCLHSLESSLICFSLGMFKRKTLNFLGNSVFKLFFKKCKLFLFIIRSLIFECRPFAACLLCLFADFFYYSVRIFGICQKFNCSFKIDSVTLSVCFLNARSHWIIKVRHTLTAVLVILVRLNCNTCKCRIWRNVIRFSQIAVTCWKTAFKKAYKVNLATSCGKCKEIKIVNMNITVTMSLRILRVENVHFIELFCALWTVLEHCTHCSITVNVCVLTLNIVIFSWFKSKVLINLHELCVHFTHSCTLCTVKYIFLCSSCMTVFNKHLFNSVLYLLNCRSLISALFLK